ncbi:MAG: hypothetical protein ABF839_08635 [Acetobacter orientalis]|uniref:Uncharacterized protein n=1 Tax=Acetobacter orientalis TaxID=146474 RepID=A0A0D6NLU2_9PROT|nr:hypothetical protein [Acetobacter orientalis]MDN6040894.1 hypothetical protein [Acetobacter sp.]GAN66336.1 hypothetical protein Abor_019_015 [Acetobacter orientalis]GEL62561.1 hypothetical protein AOR02nite_24030 [Acetobacter orientalis]
MFLEKIAASIRASAGHMVACPSEKTVYFIEMQAVTMYKKEKSACFQSGECWERLLLNIVSLLFIIFIRSLPVKINIVKKQAALKAVVDVVC